MRHFRSAATAFGLLVLITLPASAQRPGGWGMMGGPAALLSNKGVQKELKLDDSQVTKVTKMSEELRAKQREAMQGYQDLSPEERREKGMELSRTMNSETDKALGEVFKPEQVTRYKQIRLQVSGANAMADPEVAGELKMTAEQKTKVKDMLSSQQGQMLEIFQSSQDDREAAMKRINDMRKETKEKIIALMTSDQKKSWETLVGEAFEYVPTPPPGR